MRWLNHTGTDNTATGYLALFNNTTGSGNIAVGSGAGFNLTTGDENIDVFDPGVADESLTVRIGTQNIRTTTFIAGIFGTSVSGAAVVVNSAGQLGVSPSSRRFKEGIKPMEWANEELFALKPITFHYKKEIDPAGTSQFGLVAEDVEKVNPDLVVRDKEGKAYTVRYEAVNAMLLNEFLKEHKRIETQQATITQLKSKAAKQEATISELMKGIRVVTEQLKEQAAQIQKVSPQVEMSKPAPKLAVSKP